MNIKGIVNYYNIKEFMLEHIFWGEITKKKEIQGYHHEDISYNDAKMKVYAQLYFTSVKRLITENKNKHVYEAIVVDKMTGGVKPSNEGISTFFPREWGRQRVVDCIDRAEKNNKLIKQYNLISGKKKEKRKNLSLYYDIKEGLVISKGKVSAYPILKF